MIRRHFLLFIYLLFLTRNLNTIVAKFENRVQKSSKFVLFAAVVHSNRRNTVVENNSDLQTEEKIPRDTVPRFTFGLDEQPTKLS